MLPVARTRLAIGLVSLATIFLELVLMRILALRFWSHFAYMVISMALVGFGASGTAISIFRRSILAHRTGWLFGLALAFSLSIPLTQFFSGLVPLDLQFLAWDLTQVGYVLEIELLMFIPFFLAGGFVGVSLCDRPELLSGHYAANLIGSGLGGVVAVAMMFGNSPHTLLLGSAAIGFLAALLLLTWRPSAIISAVIVGAGIFTLIAFPLRKTIISPYKMLSQVKTMPETSVIYQTEGPLGQIDVVSGPAIHYAPGLSLQWTDPIPPHVLLIIDGDQTSAIYDCPSLEDWSFLDYTTQGAAYHLRPSPRTCIIGGGGGADIGLALFHNSPQIVVLEMNEQLIEAMTNELASYGGRVYSAPHVNVINQEARGYFTSGQKNFEIIHLPTINAFGASGAGLYATQEAYLYTVEAFKDMFENLADDGVLCITCWNHVPPRDGLRIFDTAAQTLRSLGLEPRGHLAMIRSWVTVTVLAFRKPITPEEADTLSNFCEDRSFDLCYLPGMNHPPVNPFHALDGPYFFEGAQALLGTERKKFLDEYIFKIAAPTDDKPYFFHNFRWRQLPEMKSQLGRRSRALLERGYLMLIAALGQAVILGVLLILLPLAPGLKVLRKVKGKIPTLGYFLLLGLGFMLLEMGFLQKLTLYLAHPIYSASIVISSFLIFAGIGSYFSQYWPGRLKQIITTAAGTVVVIALFYVITLDGWLGLTQSKPIWLRFLIASCTICPLALAMGHMFPTGLRQLGGGLSVLVPWAWAVNGFASVVATVAAPLLAMNFGFLMVVFLAIGCYALAGLIGRFLPRDIVKSCG